MMQVRLMHPERDFVPAAEIPRQRHFRDPDAGPRHDLSTCERETWMDLDLDTLAVAMSEGDGYLFDVARKALLLGSGADVETIAYRQATLRDCIANAEVVRAIYALVEKTIDAKKKHHFGGLTRYPTGILREAVELMRMLMTMMRRLVAIANAHSATFRSPGMQALFAMLVREFDEGYIDRIERHLADLRFRGGVLMSARLGPSNEGIDYVLRQEADARPGWLKRLLRHGPREYRFRLHERDEAGARILSTLMDRGIDLVANALAQSTEHVLSFFLVLRVELAFYVGCLNLRDRLVALDAPISFPAATPKDSGRWRFADLYDPCLAIRLCRRATGNSSDASDHSLVIVTGANQGGKSTFLRSIGIAHLMMQAGMFVCAQDFEAELVTGVLTHFKREEDAAMKGGRLDEELARMDAIVAAIRPGALVLFNESFASTNEREGSEIARQVVRGLLECGARIVYVTHLYDFARGEFEAQRRDALFLRANREPNGRRTFELVEAGPLATSYGEDLYREVFGETG